MIKDCLLVIIWCVAVAMCMVEPVPGPVPYGVGELRKE